jgi:hypothetical protein
MNFVLGLFFKMTKFMCKNELFQSSGTKKTTTAQTHPPQPTTTAPLLLIHSNNPCQRPNPRQPTPTGVTQNLFFFFFLLKREPVAVPLVGQGVHMNTLTSEEKLRSMGK